MIAILVAVIYIVVAILIYLIGNYIDGRKIGQGKPIAHDANEDNTVAAVLWPLLLVFFVLASPFVLASCLGNWTKKLGKRKSEKENERRRNSNNILHTRSCNC